MISRITRALLLSVVGILLLVAPVLGYIYSAPVAITENASTAYTMLPVLWDQNNTWLAANGFMSSTANDTRVQTLGGLNRPWMVADNKTLTAVAVPADSQTNLYFVTGESAASAMDIILGQGGYVTTADNSSTEISANGSISASVYLLDGVSANISRKPDAFSWTWDGSGNITFTIPERAGAAEVLEADGAGDATALSVAGAATNWQAVSDNSDASYVYMEVTGWITDYYNISTMPTIPTSATIDSVSVYYRSREVPSQAGTQYSRPSLRLAAIDTTGTQYNLTDSWVTNSEVLTKPGGGSWSVADLASLQVGISLYDNTHTAGDYMEASKVYVEVAYTVPEMSVTALGVASGARDVDAWLDATDLGIDVGGFTVNTTALGGVSIFDSSNSTVWMEGIPYAESLSVSVNGTQSLLYQPNEIVLGNNLPDRAGSNNGTITWGSNPTGVGVTLGSMTSAGQPDIGATTDTATSDILPVVGGADWRPDTSVSATLLANPLRPIVTAVSDNTTLSEYQVWVWYGIIFVVFIVALVGANVRGHHLITGIAASAAIVLMVVWTVFPLLTLIVVVLAVWGGLVSERSPSL